ncbi:DJ-1/PfpI family protein [Pantoea stewartii]|uniref:DJ-1/PfpI family protein n=1 Tax=Pantoea stewartii TaxID=66269 RepID=UPI002DB6B1AA|nr:DJ-1/PfpI family protein [Pantoea stewartii]MEB6537074.1 DJ-1/PfpI family protein [Pantoea stewartii]
MQERYRVLIPIYDGVTQLDFTGPYQFFSRTPQFEPVVASLGGEPVEADGLRFSNLADLNSQTDCDILCVPGGSGCTNAIQSEVFMASVRRLAQTASYITSVCSGSLILGAAGLIKGKRAACHWAWRDQLPLFGAIPDKSRVVRDGNVITGGGVTAGIDFALVVIAELCGKETAMRVQLGLEYAPEPPFNAGLPETAPVAISKEMIARSAENVRTRKYILEAAAKKLKC